MRATETQLRDALLAGDKARRSLAAAHIERARPEFFPLLLEVLRNSRPIEPHDHLHLVAARMVRDEPMFDALIGLLPHLRKTWTRPDTYLDDPVSQVVRDVPPALLLDRYQQLRELAIEPYAKQTLQWRAAWLRREPATALRALDAFGRKYADYRGSMPVNGGDMEYAAESAARDIELSRQWFNARRERLSLLPDEYPQDDLYWLAHLAIDLAGYAGVREAVPLALNCIGLDDDLLHESCHHALRRLMDADLLRAMDDHFDDARGWPRRSFADIAGDRPPPEAPEVFARWMDISYDGDELGTIATAAVRLLDASLLPRIERVVTRVEWDMMYADLAGDYLAACAILAVEPQDRRGVERAQRRAQRRRDRLFGQLREPLPKLPTVVPPALPVNRIKIGPNEPCTCGSGRKFKKCCMSKSAAAR